MIRILGHGFISERKLLILFPMKSIDVFDFLVFREELNIREGIRRF